MAGHMVGLFPRGGGYLCLVQGLVQGYLSALCKVGGGLVRGYLSALCRAFPTCVEVEGGEIVDVEDPATLHKPTNIYISTCPLLMFLII